MAEILRLYDAKSVLYTTICLTISVGKRMNVPTHSRELCIIVTKKL